MSSWSHNFHPATKELSIISHSLPTTQVVAFVDLSQLCIRRTPNVHKVHACSPGSLSAMQLWLGMTALYFQLQQPAASKSDILAFTRARASRTLVAIGRCVFRGMRGRISLSHACRTCSNGFAAAVSPISFTVSAERIRAGQIAGV